MSRANQINPNRLRKTLASSLTHDTVKFEVPDLALFLDLANIELNNTHARILKSTEQGKDAHGRSLKAYSAAYIRAIRAGHVRGHNGVRKVNTLTTLRITGDLLNSMQVKKNEKGAEIFFNGSHATGASGAPTRPPKSPKPKAPGGNTSPAKSARAKRVSGTGRRIGAKLAKAAHLGHRAGGTGSIPNSQLAATLERKGFTGWFEYGEEDLARIEKSYGAALEKMLARMVQIKKA